jgi:hypothetical protein
MTTPLPPQVTGTNRLMTIKYTVTRWDVLRWQAYVLVHGHVINGVVLIFGLALAWDFLRLPSLAVLCVQCKLFLAVSFLVVWFCIFAMLTMIAKFVDLLSRKHRGFLGDHELEVRDAGLVERTDVNESLHLWAGFHKVVSSRRYFYVYVTDSCFLIVPLRCFASKQEQSAFRDAIKNHLKAP